MKWFLFLTFMGWAVMLEAQSWKEHLRQSTARLVEDEAGAMLELSLPDEQVVLFELESSELISPGLAASFPQIRAWKGRSLAHPDWLVRCDDSPFGLHVQILTPHGTVYLDQPVETGSAAKSVRKADSSIAPGEFHCLTEAEPQQRRELNDMSVPVHHEVRTFRLAVATSGEYTGFHGGTVESGLASVVTVFNRVSGIYEKELGVRLVLVPGVEQLIFTNSLTDPFTNNAPTLGTAAQAQAVFDQVIGTENYDVGMLLNTGTYGLAFLATVCDPSMKGSACMGLPEPAGERFTTYVAHEMAHQFGANHSFNSGQSTCGANRYAGAAVEPGTGSTLMSYAGLPCGGDSLQPLMSDYFHAESIREIRLLLLSAACGEVTATTNHLPIVTAPATLFVPKGTPFILRAEAFDPDGDDLLYSWEQMDTGPAASLSDPDNGFSPLFRSFPPTADPVRIFPSWEALLRNEISQGERLPETNRMMHFRVTVRDSQNMGSTAYADTHVEVVDAGPFRMTSHNEGYFRRGEQVITWDVAETINAPFNAQGVNLLLSTNAGETFDIVLATNTPNDGIESVFFPDVVCSRARLKIQPVDQIFFDVNDADIVIGNQPSFSSSTIQGTNLVLRWIFEDGKEYRVEEAPDLFTGSWTERAVPISTNGSQMEAIVPIAIGHEKFFRLYEIE